VARIVFVYSTVDGHTLEICERLQRIAASEGHQSTLQELTADSVIDLNPFDRIVIGASVRYGRHRPEVACFVERHIDILTSSPNAFFSVNAVARKPGKRDPESNPYVRKFFRSITWRPALVAIFGGKIDYPKYRFWDKTMIRIIMWMTNGPTDPTATVDFTDWDEVEEFGRAISRTDPNAA
jgi:menaquinone-dependent protoporphyrinogen oxidase